MRLKRQADGTTLAFGWTSEATMVWLWHVLFDGTRVCRCFHSRSIRADRRVREAGAWL